MNLGVALKIARILSLAAARARNRDSKKLSGATLNIILGAIFLVGSAVGAYLIANATGLGSAMIGVYLGQFLIVMPSMIMFFCLVYGLLFEFNQSVFNVSLDAINWLPVTAEDYVLGSTLSTLYSSFPILTILVGATFGLAVFSGGIPLWLLTIALSGAGALIGAFTMELIRVVFNRASSSISKKSGKTAVAGRFILSVLVIALFSSIYNFNVIVKITGWFISVAGAAWFFPLIWPSLSIMSLINSDTVGAAIFFVLTAVLTVVFFYAGVRARNANWAPEVVTLTLTENGKQRAPDKRLLGFTQGESAILRKDLRGLVRRREMMGFLAMPFIMVIVNMLNGGFSEAFSPDATLFMRLFLFALPGFGLLMLSFFVSASGVGSEGSGFINLRASPVSIREIARAKLAVALIPSLAGLLILVTAATLVLNLPPTMIIFITVFGLVTLLEAATTGLATGAHYADYTEVPRARFITPFGSMIGMGVLMLTIGITYGAFLATGFLKLGLPTELVGALLVAVIGGVVAYGAYRLAVGEVGRAYETAPN
jgi:hypothetical protein